VSSSLVLDGAVDGDDPLFQPLVADLDTRRSVSLDEACAVAGLATRFELKYLVPLASLAAVLERLPDHLAALDIDGRRAFVYESVYFDTEDLSLYTRHAQGRPKRFKVRTRSYCDSGDTMFEVKLKGRRGQTVKERIAHDFDRRAQLTREARCFVETIIADAYGQDVPDLQPVLTTRYHRATLVDLDNTLRLTIDLGLRWAAVASGHGSDDLALVESKSTAGPGHVDAVLRSVGIRPVSISKYCAGVALLHGNVPANRWSRVLRQRFDWERAAEV
jgi:inorganic triphosphatase YgiF